MSAINEALKKALENKSGRQSEQPQEGGFAAPSATKSRTPRFILIFATFFLIAGIFLAANFFYSEIQKEKKLRVSSQEELSRLGEDLERNDLMLTQMKEDKKEIENILQEKEERFKATQDSLSKKADRLTRDKLALESDKVKNQSKIAELAKKVRDLELQKSSQAKEIESLKGQIESASVIPAVNA